MNKFKIRFFSCEFIFCHAYNYEHQIMLRRCSSKESPPGAKVLRTNLVPTQLSLRMVSDCNWAASGESED